jgi:hypothetical protein
MSAAKTITEAEYRESPVYWFVRLEKSRERQDHEQAAQAIRELRRLGVDVRFNPRGTTR